MALREIKTDTIHYWVDENNDRQGMFTAWNEHGIKIVQSYFLDSKLHGHYLKWDDDGRLVEDTNFYNGYYHGAFKFYYRGTDKVNEMGFFEYGSPHGEYKKMAKTGKLLRHRVYVNGDRLPIIPYNISDKKKFELTLRYGIRWL